MTKKKNSKRETLLAGMKALHVRLERQEKFSVNVSNTMKLILQNLERAENFLFPLFKTLMEKGLIDLKEVISFMHTFSECKTLAEFWDLSDEEFETLLTKEKETISEDE